METGNETIGKDKRMKKISFGLIVILAGIFLLAFNFGVLPWDIHHIIFSWQMLLIAIGVISFMGGSNRTPGIILIMIGGFFMVPEIFLFHINFVKIFWPGLLIIIGLLILFRRGLSNYSFRHHAQPGHITFDEGYINETNIFSGSKHKVTSQEFRGGRIGVIFGGSEVDLTHAGLAEGRNELTIDCLFGGVTLMVPSDWKVIMNVTTILGGFSDKRTFVKEPPDASRVLVIRGSAVFGGGEIKCC